MRESEIERYLVNQFQTAGAQVRKLQYVGRNGAPDRMIMFRRNVIFIELKAPGKKLRPDQQREFMRMKSQGIRVYKVDSKEAVDNLLKHYPYDYDVDDVPF
jgi:hypothetical protein